MEGGKSRMKKEKKVKKGWKVTNEFWESWAAPCGEGGVQYVLEKRVFPAEGCGPLVVCRTKRQAKKLLGPGDVMHPCRYLPSSKKSVWYVDSIGRRWRQTLAKLIKRNPTDLITDDTVLADWVEILPGGICGK
jgi:hypothetical protein